LEELASLKILNEHKPGGENAGLSSDVWASGSAANLTWEQGKVLGKKKWEKGVEESGIR